MSQSFYLPEAYHQSVKQAFSQTGFADIEFVEGFATAVDDRWPEDFTYLYRNRVSSRPIEVEKMGDGLNIRIFSHSSLADYELALKLVASLMQLNGNQVHPEGNDPMNLDTFRRTYDLDWCQSQIESLNGMLLDMVANNPQSPMKLSGINTEMEIGQRMFVQLSRDTSGEKNNLDKSFYWLNYYSQEDVYIVPLIVLGEENGGPRRVRVAVYGENVRSLIPDRGTVVRLSSEADLGNKGASEETCLTLDDVADLLGDKALWVTENLLLLEPVTGQEWADLMDKAKASRIDDIFAMGFKEGEDPFAMPTEEPDLLDSESLKLLSYAPVIVFFYVALADGKVDEKEMRAFETEVLAGIQSESQIMITVLTLTVAHFETIKNELLNLEFDITERLAEIMSIVKNRLSETESRKFREALFSIGYSVAQTSGGLFKKMGQKEKEALAILAGELELLDEVQ